MLSDFQNKLTATRSPRRFRPTRMWLASVFGCALTLGGMLASAGIWAQDTPEGLQKRSEAALTSPNLLQNGDFALGSAAWKSELANGKASGSLSWPADAVPPTGVTGKVARFDVDAIDKERWHVQFYQNGLNLNNNETYTLTFRAKANQERPLSVSANADEEDYHPLGLENRVSLSPQWRQYTLVFTVLHARKDHARVCFMLGDAMGRVELAQVRLQKGAVPASPGSNLLHNADFADGLNSWLPLRVEAPAQATLQITDEQTPANVGGKVAHLVVSEPGTQVWHAYFGQGGLALEEGGVYTLSFRAKSSRSRALIVHSDIEQGDYHQTGLRHVIALTPEWNKFTFVFTPTNTANSASRIIFSVGDATGDADIAGVSLQRGAVLPIPKPAPAPTLQTARANPSGKGTGNKTPNKGETRAHRSHPLLGTWQSFHKEEGLTGREYQRYRFVFEANGSGSLQVATMSADPAAPPKSQRTETFKWDLIEGGPHVSIGANVYTWTIEKDGAKQKLTLKNYEGKTYILFRQ